MCARAWLKTEAGGDAGVETAGACGGWVDGAPACLDGGEESVVAVAVNTAVALTGECAHGGDPCVHAYAVAEVRSFFVIYLVADDDPRVRVGDVGWYGRLPVVGGRVLHPAQVNNVVGVVVGVDVCSQDVRIVVVCEG